MIGPSIWAALSRSLGLFAPQFDPLATAPLWDAADGRGQKYSSDVNGCGILARTDDVAPSRSDPFAVRRLPLALVGKGGLADGPQGERIRHAADGEAHGQHQQIGANVCHLRYSGWRRFDSVGCQTRPKAAITTSITLIPVNGAPAG